MSAIFNDPKLAVVALILGFGFLIFVHELGHFAVAKWCGIRATQFAIGFGHALLSYRKGMGLRVGGTEKEYFTRALEALENDGKSLEDLSEHKRNQMIMEKADELGLSETEYRLNWIPLGGYVKMLGQEDLDPAAQSDDPRAYNKKSIGARMAVISAGVIMNLIFALIFFIICFQIGVKFPAPVVGGIDPDQPAGTTYARGHDGDAAYRGMLPGDVITHIDGKPITDMAEVKIAMALGKDGRAVALRVQREGEAKPIVFDITAEASDRNEGLLSAGIYPADTLTLAESAKEDGKAAILPQSPLARLPLKPGMQLSAVNGQAVENLGQYRRVIEQVDGPRLSLVFNDPANGEIVESTADASPSLTIQNSQSNLLGLLPISTVSPSSKKSRAFKAGVRDYDVVAKLGDAAWPSPSRLQDVVKSHNDGSLPITVLRGEEIIELEPITPKKGLIGVALGGYLQTNRVGGVLPDSAFAKVAADRPLPPGSTLTSVNSQPIENWTDFQYAVMQTVAATEAGQPAELVMNFEVNLGETSQEDYRVALTADEVNTLRQELTWLRPAGIGFEQMMTEVKADGPVEATMIGAVKTKEFIQQTYITLLRLFQGSIKVNNLRGPVGIVDQGAKVASQGLPYFLFFLGLISVNLAVLNFLPLPIVDGGHMVFLIIEKLKGSPASPKVQIAVSLVGLVGLACIFLYVTFNDISRLVAG